MTTNDFAHRKHKASALARIKRALKDAHPSDSINAQGYVPRNWDNLIDGVCPGDFEADLSGGDGDELGRKFRAVDSSSALVVNAFAPFRRRIRDLGLPTGGRFDSITFERKCSAGMTGTPPHLDVVLEGPGSVVGIESKLKEYLEYKAKKIPFSPQYEERIWDERRQSAWFELMLDLNRAPELYRYVNATQLAKHAFGLAHTFRDVAATLVYLYWEPTHVDGEPAFAEHRREVENLLGRVGGHAPTLVAVRYVDLWDLWERGPDWLVGHVTAMRARYEVEL